ncbi:MAG TPA: TIGR02996 domain-containing protein [Kofleriaceae bacterium]|nr:TIGR02996 domain-containing protein [Kofleriaceae bacterium]
MGDELLARIQANPDDADAYLVHADQLTERGDPHGELIVLMHQLQHATDDAQQAHLGNALHAYQTKHRKRLFGELGQHTGITWDFHLGFLRSVRVLPDIQDELPSLVRAILQLPIARLLRELQVFDRYERARDDVRAIVAKHRPPTLPGVEFPIQYSELDDAREAGDKVQWLALHTDGGELPAGVDSLANLEWLEVHGMVEQLPRALGKLTKLRRLDVDFCYALESIPDEVFGIESLAYLSMYDCHALPKAYQMSRLNHLLFGFARARTSKRRRIIELNLLLGRHSRAQVLASHADLLAALDSNVTAVREAALQCLAATLPDPFVGAGLPAGAAFALLGKTNFAKQQLATELTARGATLATKILDTTTHVILGAEPAGKQAELGGRPIVLDVHLAKLFESTATRPRDPVPAIDRAAIRVALASRDEAQTASAVATLATQPETSAIAPLLVDLVAVAQDIKLGKSRDAAKKLIALRAPAVDAAMKKHLKSSLLLESMGEAKRSDRIRAFCNQASAIDPLELAHRLVARGRAGLGYVLARGTTEDITRVLDTIVARSGGVLDLSAADLATVPAEVAAFTHVEDVNLAGNHLRKFPEAVLALTSLRRLDLQGNRIARVPDAIASLPLERLSLAFNRLRQFPQQVLALSRLEVLELSNQHEYGEDEARIHGIPEGIGALHRLRKLGFGFNVLDRFPASFWELPIEELDFVSCTLPVAIPRELAKLARLEKLTIAYSSWASRKTELQAMLPRVTVT